MSLKEPNSFVENYARTSLVEVVTKTLRHNIYTGLYKPGERLIVRELSEQLGVSHTPIKDALNRLVYEGYVVSLPRRSMIVREYTNSQFVEALQLRMVIELCSAPDIVAAAKESTGCLDEMRRCHSMIDSCLKPDGIDYETWIEYETKFHGTYMNFCTNQKMRATYSALDCNRVSYFTYLCNNKTPLTRKRFKNDSESHKAIIQAIERYDVEKLKQAFVEHIVQISLEYAVDEESKQKLEGFSGYLQIFNLNAASRKALRKLLSDSL